MAIGITLTNITSLQNEATALAALASNNTAITNAFQDAVALDGNSPMQSQLDMNLFKIINLAAPTNPTDAARLQDVGSNTVTPGTTSTSGGAANKIFYDDGSKVQEATVGANLTLSGGILSASGGGGGGSPGGIDGQIQFNDSGSFGGFTASGDATIDAATGAVAVSKTGGVAFAASATTDTTDASNITSGTLPAAQLPNPSGTTLGGVKSLASASHRFLTQIGTDGSVSQAQPAFTDISGQATLAQLPSIGAGTILGNTTGSTAVPVALTETQVTAMLNAFTASLQGAVPASGGGTTNFLRADGTWDAPAGGGGGSPGGSNTQIQYDNSGAFGGISGATTDGTSVTFGNGNLKLAGSSSGTAILEAPATSGGTITLPAGSVTLAALSVAQTWSAAQTFGSGDLKLAGSSSGSTILNAAATASGTLTLPAATDTLTGKATTDTLTNKTITSSTNSLGGVTAAFGSDAKGDIYTNSGTSNVIARLAVGTTHQFIGNSSGLPAWAQPAFTDISGRATSAQVPTDVAYLDVADQTVSGGANVTVASLTTGNVTIDCGTCPLQKITNGGIFTITAPASDGSCMLMITNNGSASTVTFSGFSVGTNTGDALDTTNAHVFTVSIWRINGVAGYRIAAHQ